MEIQPLDQAVNYALKKKAILDGSKLQYLTRAALSGVYIGFGIMISYRIAEPFFEVHSPATYLMTGLFFGIALLLIMYGGGELFTGNTMAFTISTLKGATTWKDTFRNWIACYSGNFIGAIFFATMIMLTGLYGSPEKTKWLMESASLKMNAPTYQVFFRAILCNWLVCLAIWIPMNVKGDGSKIASMMLLVFGFVVSGYEHSIANLVLFSLALVVPHPETISVTQAIANIIPVTFGNIIGGAVFVGVINVFLASKPKTKQTIEAVEAEEAKVNQISKVKAY
ncbi:formate/nitrite transporter family protein [Bacillus sp. 03113]|uniref:formate/nitrite transporter family protein n=1 Tax=Bacillus sp. 03113 TaxID=2578211 RepID=UPI001141B9EB|nr:formate/nitrite transporter family protein [Bacillus sp. 03113]